MARHSSHYWLKHGYRSEFWLGFWEKRRVFMEQQEEETDEEASFSFLSDELRTVPEFSVEVPTNKKEAERILKDIQTDQVFIDQIKTGKLSAQDVGFLMSKAEVNQRFDSGQLKEIEKAVEVMYSRERNHQTFIEHEVQQAVFRKYAETTFTQEELLKKNKRQLKELNKKAQREMEKREIRKDMEAKMSKDFRTFGSDTARQFGMGHLKEVLENLQKKRIEAVQTYLEKKSQEMEGRFESYAHLFETSTLRKRLEKVKSEVASLKSNESVPKAIENIENELTSIRLDFEGDFPKLRKVEKNREKLTQEIKENYEKIISFQRQIKSNHIQTLIDILEDPNDHRFDGLLGGERGELEEIGRKNAISHLKKLQEGTDPEIMEDLESIYQEQLSGLNEMSAEKLQRLHRKLKTKAEKVPDASILEVMEEIANEPKDRERAITAQNARYCIDNLNKAKNLNSLVRMLRENLNEKGGKNRIEVVDEGTFRNYDLGINAEPRYVNLNSFTTDEGGMVFHQRGDEWNIIINADKFTSGEVDLDGLKKQIRHELLHVEFEHSPEKYRKKTIKDLTSSPHWPEIKENFLKLNKRPPNFASKWSDYDIAHELYAMQHDIGQKEVSEETIQKLEDPVEQARARLSNAWRKANTHEQLGLKNPKKAEDMFRGMEKGVDDILAQEAANGGEYSEDTPSASSSASGSKEKKIAEGNYGENLKTIDEFDKEIEDSMKSPIAGSIRGLKDHLKKLKNENQKTRENNEALKQYPGSRGIAKQVKDRNGTMKEAINEVKDAIKEVKKEEDDGGDGFFKTWRNNTRWTSATGFKKMATKFFTYLKEWSELNTDDEGDLLGNAAFGASRMGRKYASSLAGNENKQMENWKEGMKEFSPAQLLDNLKRIADSFKPNKFELKATLRLLADSGRLDWNDQNLWKVLNRLQSATYFKYGDKDLFEDKTLVQQKMRKALTQIFDSNEYNSLQQSNESSYDSKKGTAAKEAETEGAVITSILARMLRNKRDGVDVEPYKFEGVLDYAIDAGRSDVEHLLFSIFAGIARGLIKPDRAVVLTKWCNKIPHVDFFLGGVGPITQENFEKICKEKFGYAYERCGLTDEKSLAEFQRYMTTVVERDENVRWRTRNAASTVGKFDKDHMRAIVRMGNANTIDYLTSGQSGRVSLEPNRVDNMVVGTLQGMEEYCRAYSEGVLSDKDMVNIFTDLAANFAMQHGALSGVYASSERDRARYSPTEARSQMSYITFHKDWTVQQNVSRMLEILNTIDPDFFKMIFDDDFKANPKDKVRLNGADGRGGISGYLKSIGAITEEKTFSNIDEVYKQLDNFMPAIMRHAARSGRLEALKGFSPEASRGNIIDLASRRKKASSILSGGRQAA